MMFFFKGEICCLDLIGFCKAFVREISNLLYYYFLVSQVSHANRRLKKNRSYLK